MSSDTYGLTVSNQGSLGLTAGSTPIGNFTFGIYALQTAVGAGSSQQGVVVVNSGSIDLDLSTAQAWGGAAIWASDRGGPQGGDSVGATVNNSEATSVAVNNSGAISVAMTGSDGAAGIQAISYSGYDGYGGTAGTSSILNSGSVDVTWAWQDVGSQGNGVSGLMAQSQGSPGTLSSSFSGTTGGSGGTASVSLTRGGDVSVAVSGKPPSRNANSAGILAEVIGGDGGGAPVVKYQVGGNGGAAGTAQITILDASVRTSGSQLPGLLTFLQGGAGGAAGCQQPANDCTVTGSAGSQHGGGGGWVSGDGSTITVTASSLPVTISTTGDQSAAIQAQLFGGVGAAGDSDNTDGGGTAGNGGDGGTVLANSTINLAGTGPNLVSVTTAGDGSPGIYAQSVGGDGGAGGQVQVNFGPLDGTAGSGGAGGSGDNITIDLVSASIGTQGSASPGILAQSLGGTGGAGGSAQGAIDYAYGGQGARVATPATSR